MAKSQEPEIEIKAKIKGADGWKEWKSKDKKINSNHGTSGALYFVGFVGALIYWTQAANGLWEVILGVLKASVWPAYVVYKLLENFYGVVI